MILIPLIFWQRLTVFGDVIVTLPAAVVILINLVSARAWRLAACWALWFAAAMALVVVTKLAFIGWGVGIQSLDFTGLSGHAMRACAVLPVIGYLACQTATDRWRQVGVAIGTALGLLIAFSRIAVHVHSVSEVVTGALLGLVVAAIFVHAARLLQAPVRALWLAVAALAGLLLATGGEPAPTQQILTRIALTLSGHSRAFTRDDWSRPPRPLSNRSGAWPNDQLIEGESVRRQEDRLILSAVPDAHAYR